MNYTVTEDQATGLFIVADESGELDRVDSEEMGWDIVRNETAFRRAEMTADMEFEEMR